jgi:hypothetical protein
VTPDQTAVEAARATMEETQHAYLEACRAYRATVRAMALAVGSQRGAAQALGISEASVRDLMRVDPDGHIGRRRKR